MTPEKILEFQFFLLLGYAATATTLVGFIGLVFSTEGRNNQSLDNHESSTVFHFMFAGLSAVFMSLLAIVALISMSNNHELAWRLMNGLGAIIHLTGTIRIGIETSQMHELKKRGWILTAVGGTFGIFSAAAASGFLSTFSPTIFLMGTMWAIAVTAISFISLVVSPKKRKH